MQSVSSLSSSCEAGGICCPQCTYICAYKPCLDLEAKELMALVAAAYVWLHLEIVTHFPGKTQ